MAEVIGKLRKEATPGEVQVLDLLRRNLPKDFTVYVEVPISVYRKTSYPDFIILTNYGFVILEVKDWSNFTANPHQTVITTRDGKRFEGNPVNQARDYALDLSNAIENLAKKQNLPKPFLPYGYAAVLPFFPAYYKNELQSVWGESNVLVQEDLEAHLINRSIRNTVREDKINPIPKQTMDLVRAAIYPEIAFGSGIILDDKQAEIVLEGISESTTAESQPSKPQNPKAQTSQSANANLDSLFEELKPTAQEEEDLPLESEKIISTNTVRLVRGVMGSGKTLVLLAKAKHLAKVNQDWKILVLSFNKALGQSLHKELKSFNNIQATNLDKLLADTIQNQNRYLKLPISDSVGWVNANKNKYEIIQSLGSDFIAKEIGWIHEVMLASREDYLNVKRVGRGNQVQISKNQRNQIYDLLLEQSKDLEKNRATTWDRTYLNFLNWIKEGKISPLQYDAILIDEAQDFAPSWIAVVNSLLKPGGYLFMVDDPTQSLFRYFSWRQRGVEVVGRTKYLNKPYRNTFEIYRAAQAVIKDDSELIRQLKTEGEDFVSEEDLSYMRRGDRPLLVSTKQAGEDITFVENQIQHLRQKAGIPYDQICVIAATAKDEKRFKNGLSKYKVPVYNANQPKGLGYDVVFLCGVENFFREESKDDPVALSQQKRMLYACMGRAQKNLYLLHAKKLPAQFDGLTDLMDTYTV